MNRYAPEICESCRFLVVDYPCMDDPYGYIGCSKQHWSDGPPLPVQEFIDSFKDCEDYEKGSENDGK